ncbi:M56 family metallopeptidase [Actinocorallia sp. API 0066]|uniref:M56 family metallopeptidase n=1 Tax=Actinocorallia sp. API 0066 TaxID=2896846 RepID=UPI001E511EBF|nr:M56 family metallopeptidase [Actinocorallia sp. API 0066]MCD0449243.1 M56 family metallopeptidase [Actinocorallia sp. API 0066]
MTWLTLLPTGLALVLGVALGRAPLPLHPSWAGRVLCTVAGTATLATVGTLLFVAVNHAATRWPHAADRLPEWALFGDEEPVSALLGLGALLLLLGCLFVVVRLGAHWVAEVRAAQRLARPLPTDVPVALAVPGRRGGVLVSRGLVAALSPAELDVVRWHEASHLRHRHHRYLAVGALAAELLPPLRPLHDRLRFALERWADEDAAEAVGDRALVARTIARVALLQPRRDPGPLGAFADAGVVRRVEALLGGAPCRNPIAGPVVLVGTGLVSGALALTALQLDHALDHALDLTGR